MNNNENETLILESTRRALEESKGKVPEVTVKPFVVQNENVIVKKKYLVLKYYSADDDGEEVRDFDFFEGTTQELYEYLKDEKKDLIHLEKLDRESCLEVFEKYEKMNGIIY